MKNHYIQSLVLLFLFQYVTLASNQYILADLGQGSAFSINNSGQIVGSSNGRALLFDSTGAGSNIDLGPGAAWAINDNGRIVGNTGTYGNEDAVVFNSWGGIERVLESSVVLSAINNNDQIVGTAFPKYVEGSGRKKAYYLNPVSGYPNYTKTYMCNGLANSINDSAEVVGCTYWESTPSGPFDPIEHDWKAVIFDTTGNRMHTYLSTLPGNEESIAKGINEDGKIIGYAFNYVNNDIYSPYEDIQAVLFDETGSGSNTALGFLDGYVNSSATAINGAGEIVGCCFNDYNYELEFNPYSRATMFVPDGVNIDLNTMLSNPLPGWTLTEALAINDNGWIVGRMWNTSFEVHAFLLKPVPEPTTLSFLLFGALGIIKNRRKST